MNIKLALLQVNRHCAVPCRAWELLGQVLMQGTLYMRMLLCGKQPLTCSGDQ